jgi:ribonucleotide reductase beta subunit family protein with ferritin-like domain
MGLDCWSNGIYFYSNFAYLCFLYAVVSRGKMETSQHPLSARFPKCFLGA